MATVKRVWAVLASLVLLIGVTGCKPEIEKVKEDAEIVKICESNGGKAFHDSSPWREVHCDYEKR